MYQTPAINIYSQQDYYPTPSQNVITYKMPSLNQTRRAVLKADVYALVVYLTSPMDSVDYNIFSDFFLIYRNFLSSIELYDLLISRFKWCINEILTNINVNFDGIEEKYHPKKIAEITLIRTFVLLRHWILNYFINDFLPNVDLRKRFIKFLNSAASNNYPKIINSSFISLKKSWILNCKKTWDNLKLNEPAHIGHEDEWSSYTIKDITDISDEEKRDSRLSNHAFQEITDPDSRNKSILSTYRNSDVFRLPSNFNLEKTSNNNDKNYVTNARKLRTASMVLFPQDNLSLNYKTTEQKSEEDDLKSLKNKNQHQMHSDSNSTVGHERKVSILSKITNISSVIKELDYPKSCSLDTIIPPTPSKKVEFILKTNFLPDEIKLEDTDEFFDTSDNYPLKDVSIISHDKKPSINSVIEDTDIVPNNHTEHSHQMSDTQLMTDGENVGKISTNYTEDLINENDPIGLLSKWKTNHNNPANNLGAAIETAHSDSISNSKKELDKFVKYVISISSIGQKPGQSEEILDSISTNFDILSGRTIDEVEFLKTIENNLLNKLHRKVPHFNSLGRRSKTFTPENEFSTVDNLNLYHTVSSIANSVISLTNTLNNENKHDSSPFKYDNNNRRMVRSTMQSQYPNKVHPNIINSSQKGFVSNPELDQHDGPQRLIFQGDTRDQNIKDNFTPYSKHDKKLSTLLQKNPGTSSPLKNLITSMETDDIDQDIRHSTETSVSYDSMHSFSTQKSEKEQLINIDQDCQSLKKKSAKGNLREKFTFEQSSPLFSKTNSKGSNISVSQSHYSDTNENPSSLVIDKAKKHITYTAVKPSSGRISIIKRNSLPTYHKRITTVNLESLISEDSSYLEKDKLLSEFELDAFDEISLRDSKYEVKNLGANPSDITIATSRLLDLENNPIATNPSNLNNGTILSNIQSIHSIETNSSYDTTSSSLESENIGYEKNLSPTKKATSLREQFLGEKLQAPKLDNPPNLLSIKVSNGTSSFEGSPPPTSKYVYASETESISAISPAKDMEQLKKRFLQTDKNSKPSMHNSNSSSAINDHNRGSGFNEDLPKGLEAISNLPDDSFHDDPLAIALMKLEGTFSKNLEGNMASSEQNKISNVMKLTKMSNKRNSLFFEKRRNTIMNIPFTPESKREAELREQKMEGVSAFKIQKLFEQYKLEDSRLMISNVSHHIPFILMYDSLSIAEQLTLIEKELLSEVDWEELLNLKVVHEGLPAISWLQLLIQNETLSGVDLVISRFNLTVDWIISEIALTTNTKLKRNTIQRFIHVAEHCNSLQNYNTLMQIVLALNSTKVQSYRDAWRLIEPGDILSWQQLKQIPSLDSNYSTIRHLMNELDPIRGCIPFIVVYLSDLSLNSEKRDWIVENQIVNYNKFETNVQIVKNFIQRVQWSKFYDIRPDQELLSKCVYISSLSKEELEMLN